MEGERVIPRASIENRNTRTDNVIIIDNVVYDVTEFLEDHPGGAEVLLDNGGKDASRCFRDVGHSDIALEWRQKFRIGIVPEDELRPEEPKTADLFDPEDSSPAALLSACAPPLVLAAFAVLIYFYLL